MKAINLSGQDFSRLKVIQRAVNTKRGQARWLCSCSCGNKVAVESTKLRSGHTRSCGCLQKETISEVGKRTGLLTRTHGKSYTTSYHRDNYLKNKYDISLSEYNTLFAKQYGKCGICYKHQSELSEPLFVDHNHTTNSIRGLLCRRCNSLLAGVDWYFDNKQSVDTYIKPGLVI